MDTAACEQGMAPQEGHGPRAGLLNLRPHHAVSSCSITSPTARRPGSESQAAAGSPVSAGCRRGRSTLPRAGWRLDRLPYPHPTWPLSGRYCQRTIRTEKSAVSLRRPQTQQKITKSLWKLIPTSASRALVMEFAVCTRCGGGRDQVNCKLTHILISPYDSRHFSTFYFLCSNFRHVSSVPGTLVQKRCFLLSARSVAHTQFSEPLPTLWFFPFFWAVSCCVTYWEMWSLPSGFDAWLVTRGAL